MTRSRTRRRRLSSRRPRRASPLTGFERECQSSTKKTIGSEATLQCVQRSLKDGDYCELCNHTVVLWLRQRRRARPSASSHGSPGAIVLPLAFQRFGTQLSISTMPHYKSQQSSPLRLPRPP
ncbi:hypothetical protein FKP32DRAFT_658075 [Trametes sanguinea]|nr:hypothetical protein FKP32DRAFT_658075 [Trametes sanguinea]